eukprot:CAMPEP_0185574590 /NCGR_PEP_ID=MMETSP0434-20130131/6022_1 /TAXON_ID=626734 ORGANISM="Favella taraikaensis, Strain Fe Narragansett Bay" /NCGR_SAMPLE_ID=MMETSP0434 /ASSEMBLY_ACC=CAM_ASM_000379 /LENGTH=160 /DNA_ID=CAMNT_0028191215 /DNA_START=2224 /DNA_END=2706 /DNA_ORIENTATION=-
MMKFALCDFSRFGYEIFQCHVQIIQAVEVHLSFIKLILEVQRLLNEFKLDKSRHDLANSELFTAHDSDHLTRPFHRLYHLCFENVLVGDDTFELTHYRSYLKLEVLYFSSEIFDRLGDVSEAIVEGSTLLFFAFFEYFFDLLDVVGEERCLDVLGCGLDG